MLKKLWVSILAALALSSPALADNYAVVDGNGAIINFSSKVIGGINSPYQLPAGIYAGVLTPYNIDVSGNQGVNIKNTPAFTCSSGCFTSHVALDAGSNLVGKFGIDPGTNTVQVSSSGLPSGASTAALQPGFGTAGSPNAHAVTIQGIAGGVAVKTDGSAVTQPVSGTVAISGTVTTAPGVPGTAWTYSAAMPSNTTATIVAAPGSSLRVYITGIQFYTSTSSSCNVSVLAHSGSNVWQMPVASGSSNNLTGPPPFSFTTPLSIALNTALDITTLSGCAAGVFNAQGYTAP